LSYTFVLDRALPALPHQIPVPRSSVPASRMGVVIGWIRLGSRFWAPATQQSRMALAAVNSVRDMFVSPE